LLYPLSYGAATQSLYPKTGHDCQRPQAARALRRLSRSFRYFP
jgi:hypothetical protein